MANAFIINKRLNIKPIIGKQNSEYINNRREQVVLTCLQIGHTYIIHHHLLECTETPNMQYMPREIYSETYTARMFRLRSCAKKKYYEASNLKKSL